MNSNSQKADVIFFVLCIIKALICKLNLIMKADNMSSDILCRNIFRIIHFETLNHTIRTIYGLFHYTVWCVCLSTAILVQPSLAPPFDRLTAPTGARKGWLLCPISTAQLSVAHSNQDAVARENRSQREGEELCQLCSPMFPSISEEHQTLNVLQALFLKTGKQETVRQAFWHRCSPGKSVSGCGLSAQTAALKPASPESPWSGFWSICCFFGYLVSQSEVSESPQCHFIMLHISAFWIQGCWPFCPPWRRIHIAL